MKWQKVTSNPSSTPRQLEELASQLLSRKATERSPKENSALVALIKHPNLPASTALKLCQNQGLTGHLLDNPSLSLWLLIDPGLLDGLPQNAKHWLAHCPKAPPPAIERIYQLEAAEDARKTEDLRDLAKNNFPFYRGILRNPSAPVDVLAECCFRFIRVLFSPEKFRERLGDNLDRVGDPPGGSGQLRLWQAIAGATADVPTEAELRATAARGPWSALAVASFPRAPPGLLAELHRRSTLELDVALATNVATPPGLLGSLLDQNSTEIDAALATNPLAHREMIRVVKDRCVSYIHGGFSANPRLFKYKRYTTEHHLQLEKQLRGLDQNKSLEPALLREVAAAVCHLGLYRASRLLENPGLPPDAVALFLGSPSPENRARARGSRALVAPWLAEAEAACALPYRSMPAGSFDLERLGEWLAGGPWYHAFAAARPDPPRSLLDRLDPRWLAGALLALDQRMVSGDQLFWMLRALGHFGEPSPAARSAALAPWVYLRLGEDPIGERAVAALASGDAPSQWLRGPLESVLGAAPTGQVRKALREALRR